MVSISDLLLKLSAYAVNKVGHGTSFGIFQRLTTPALLWALWWLQKKHTVANDEKKQPRPCQWTEGNRNNHPCNGSQQYQANRYENNSPRSDRPGFAFQGLSDILLQQTEEASLFRPNRDGCIQVGLPQDLFNFRLILVWFFLFWHSLHMEFATNTDVD